MFKRIVLLLALILPEIVTAQVQDLSGNWEIHSSVGGTIPITVRCDLAQRGSALTGTCTPEMQDPEASELSGSISGTTASWSYAVVFNGNPGTVSFSAEIITENGMLGSLDLAGTMAPFAAIRR